MNDYTRWLNDDVDLDPDVIAVLISDHPIGPREIMLYATKGRADVCSSLNPKSLELLAVSYYERLNYRKVVHAGRHVSTDGGLDVWLQSREGDIEGVQCKKYSVRVGKSQVIEFARSLRKAQAGRGYFWSPTGFSAPAAEYAEKVKIELYDGQRINQIVAYVFKDEVQYAREWLKNKIRRSDPVVDIEIDKIQMAPLPVDEPVRIYSSAEAVVVPQPQMLALEDEPARVYSQAETIVAPTPQPRKKKGFRILGMTVLQWVIVSVLSLTLCFLVIYIYAALMYGS